MALSNLQPVLPPELTDIVINELSDSRKDLRNFSLVARSWLPASRHHLYASLTIRGEDIISFIPLLDAPHGTFAHFLECLELSEVHFTELSELTQLMGGLPNLKRLHLSRVSVKTPCAVDVETLPRTLLDYLEVDIQDETLLSWLPAVPASRVLASTRGATPQQSIRISDYLVSVGPRLKELTFCFGSYEEATAIDFGQLEDLTTLRLVHLPAINLRAAWHAYFRQSLPSILQRLPLANKLHGPALQKIEIGVRIYSPTFLQSALDILNAVFASRQLENRRLVQFNVHCRCTLHRRRTPGDQLREGELCVAQKAFRNQVVVPLGLDSDAEGMPECAIVFVESDVRVT
ncbi:hypothetical protein MKEN_00405200 [Mycena kentingensis (nom. inval.)]|nr:hypothetical protein MKEN_00405200 [Mycena kentingensis (nom. inval.)]